MSPLWTSLIQALRGKSTFCSAIYRNYVGITRVGPNSSCWGILKPCHLQMPQWAFVAFLGKWSRCSFHSEPTVVLWVPLTEWRRFGLKSSSSFLLKPWRGVNAPGTNSTICWLYYEDFFRAFGKWLEKLESDIKQQRSVSMCRNCIMFLEATVWAFV